MLTKLKRKKMSKVQRRNIWQLMLYKALKLLTYAVHMYVSVMQRPLILLSLAQLSLRVL